MKKNSLLRMLLALGAVLLVIYISLVSPRRAVRCLPAVARYFTRSFGKDQRTPLPGPLPANRVELLVNGDEALPAMLSLIDGATRSVRFQVMLFFPDEAGMALARAMMRAAERGVGVQLSFNIDQTINGSPADSYPREKKERLKRQMNLMLEDLRAARVQVITNPAGIDFPAERASTEARAVQEQIRQVACISANHYDHRKLLIVDDTRAIMGSMNVGNAYLYRVAPDLEADMVVEAAQRDQEGKPEAWEKWFDAALRVEGPVVHAMVDEFNWRWEVLEGEILGGGTAAPETLGPAVDPLGEAPRVEDEDEDISPAYEFAQENEADPSPVKTPAEPEPDTASIPAGVEFLVQRPGTPQVGARFFELAATARSEIWVASPFVSYEPALRALQDAARRGVRVVFVFPNGRQEMGISGRLMRASAPGLVKAGMELYFNNLRMSHTKVMVVDGRYTLMGSFNLNHRSFRHDLETAVLVDDPALAQTVVDRIFTPYLQISEMVPASLHEPWNPINWILAPFT